MIQQTTEALSELYVADETAWLEAMVELIAQGRYADLDHSHLGEYLNDMAGRERREVKSRMVTLLAHLLKWEFQPEKRSQSWRITIEEQREELEEMAGSGVLRNHAEEILAEAYRKAVRRAAGETTLPTQAFPAECPYSVEQLLSTDFTAAQ